MSIPKCDWMVIDCGKSGQSNLIFCMMLAACLCGFVYVRSVLGIPASSGDNRC